MSLAMIGMCLVVACYPSDEASTEDDSIVASVVETPTIPAFDTPTVTPIESSTPTPSNLSRQDFRATVLAVMEALPTASPIPGYPPEKAEGFQWNDRFDRAYATVEARQPPPPVPTWTPFVLLTPWPTEPSYERPLGDGMLYEGPYPYLGPPCNTIAPANYWHKEMSDHWIKVCAGTDRAVSLQSQGILVVHIKYDNEEVPRGGFYYTPVEPNGIAIVDVVGNLITLKGGNGMIFYFDLATRQWVSPPTASPSPAQSPVSSPSPLLSPVPSP